jgi:hypothetical protein
MDHSKAEALPSSFTATALAASDVDHDGKLDVAVSGGTTGNASAVSNSLLNFKMVTGHSFNRSPALFPRHSP